MISVPEDVIHALAICLLLDLCLYLSLTVHLTKPLHASHLLSDRVQSQIVWDVANNRAEPRTMTQNFKQSGPSCIHTRTRQHESMHSKQFVKFCTLHPLCIETAHLPSSVHCTLSLTPSCQPSDHVSSSILRRSFNLSTARATAAAAELPFLPSPRPSKPVWLMLLPDRPSGWAGGSSARISAALSWCGLRCSCVEPFSETGCSKPFSSAVLYNDFEWVHQLYCMSVSMCWIWPHSKHTLI